LFCEGDGICSHRNQASAARLPARNDCLDALEQYGSWEVGGTGIHPEEGAGNEKSAGINDVVPAPQIATMRSTACSKRKEMAPLRISPYLRSFRPNQP